MAATAERIRSRSTRPDIGVCEVADRSKGQQVKSHSALRDFLLVNLLSCTLYIMPAFHSSSNSEPEESAARHMLDQELRQRAKDLDNTSSIAYTAFPLPNLESTKRAWIP